MKYNYSNLVISILILAAAGYIYDKFKINIDSNTQQEDLNIIKKYLLDDDIDKTIDTLSSVKKPILWIHIDYIKNSNIRPALTDNIINYERTRSSYIIKKSKK